MGPDIIEFYKKAIEYSTIKNFIYDLSDIFKEYNETLYYDSVHYNDKGNKVIAEKNMFNFQNKKIFKFFFVDFFLAAKVRPIINQKKAEL